MKNLKLLRYEHPTLSEISDALSARQIFSTSLITVTPQCQNDCLMCFTKSFREENKEETSVESYKKIVEITKGLGGKAVRIVGVGEPLLDPSVDYLLNLCKDNGLGVVLFTNGIALDEKKLRELKQMGNISLMTKLWGDAETMAYLTDNPWYKENTEKLRTDYGEVEVPRYVRMILESEFHNSEDSYTNFGLEFMALDYNIKQLPNYLAVIAEHNIAPYVRTPYRVPNMKKVNLPSDSQIEEIDEEVRGIFDHYGIDDLSFRQGYETEHCLRTAYNFVAINRNGRLFLQPCHHTTKPDIEITPSLSLDEVRDDFFLIDGYRELREAIYKNTKKSERIGIKELIEGCVCSKHSG